MPLYVIERNFADQLDTAIESAKESFEGIVRANELHGVEWLFSFLSADRKKTYCLYEASSPEAIRDAARLAGIPADEVIEIAEMVRPESYGLPGATPGIVESLVGGSTQRP